MNVRNRLLLLFCASVLALRLQAEPAPRFRALLIGISDYSATKVHTRFQGGPAPNRVIPSLGGPANDVEAMHELLTSVYKVDPAGIVTLVDQAATHDAMLLAADELAATTAAGDVVLFYYAGHGSQVRNDASDEPDKMDESIVPADSQRGAPDIRDKELRRRFNAILDKGARLTVILDSCHSGSGGRNGLDTGIRQRGINADLRDVADRSDPGPRPENRGALFISATDDSGVAWETSGSGKIYGAFSWTWIGAVRDATSGEPVMETFLRAQARMSAETPYQKPVLAGNSAARLRSFLGPRGDQRNDRTVVAIAQIGENGVITIQGGWANGLEVGSELRPVDAGDIRLIVTAIRSLGKCEARVERAGPAELSRIRSGTLLEVVSWAPPPQKPLRIWMPQMKSKAQDIAGLAASLAGEAKRRRLQWIADLTEQTPKYLLRWRETEWELLTEGTSTRRIAPADVIAAVAEMRPGSSLFVQFPAPEAIAAAMSGAASLVATERPDEADYVLVGRYAEERIAYAWVRPQVRAAKRRESPLPERTSWQPIDTARDGSHEAGDALRDAVLRLRRIRAWQLLDSPPMGRSPYHLVIQPTRGGSASDATMVGGEEYAVTLQLDPARAAAVEPRYLYVFSIDSNGKGTLLFPRREALENCLPLREIAGQRVAGYPPRTIPIGGAALFKASEPYGMDTYILLTSEERLPNPWILEWQGVRERAVDTALEELLAYTATGIRVEPLPPPSNWSIERVTRESVPPRAGKGSAR